MKRVPGKERALKQWVQKLIEQLNYELKDQKDGGKAAGRPGAKMSEERATVLFLLDTYNKNLFEVETHPIRRVREQLDAFTREILAKDKPAELEDVFFRLRQFFAQYRVAEYSYIRKSFEDFKGIIWSFVEHLGDEARAEQNEDQEVGANLQALKEAVETDSIDELRAKSKQFIAFYAESQSRKELRRSKKIRGIRKNLEVVRRQLDEADRSLRVDHLTQAYNRRSFEERLRDEAAHFTLDKKPCTLLSLDIDFFKKINDTYGHEVGDFVLVECVRLLKECFGRENDFVARVGGEEFCVILGGHTLPSAVLRAEEALNRIRKEVFVKDAMELRFTVSMGLAQLGENETLAHWMKRADTALYNSKHGGRDRYTISEGPLSQVA